MAVEVCDAVLGDAVRRQVAAYDERFLQGLREAQQRATGTENAEAQAKAFGKRDATGVEAVHDTMPTERAVFTRLLAEAAAAAASDDDDGAAAATAGPVNVLDFGCGDGRYLRQYLRSAASLQESCGRELRVVAYEVSVEALRSFHFNALQAGLSLCSASAGASDLQPGLASLSGNHLHLDFVLGSAETSSEAVGQMLQTWRGSRAFDVAVIGWGTLSSIPRLPHLSPDAFLAVLARLSRRVMNVASTTNNHIRFQRECEARRRAYAETTRPEVREWLRPKIGLANFPLSYYYKVDTGQLMFYAAITADSELARLKQAGYSDVRLHICNVINFFDIQTKPRAARINAAVITLLERGDAWGAQLLLSRAVAKAFGRPQSSLRSGSCIFDGSSKHAVFDQVARYFISTGYSEVVDEEKSRKRPLSDA
mmetsp:Transcript_15177/g.48551  ORF Transcript_15177/g.48551 Transcript_15177/m.48551 type:complete len:425 (-) Transcript_15177:66-1340(-)|eukprot:CAMPEP_0203866524 /NCGR_PEP_ID=MMETSP0359-20131031/15999_1 /ASSEMBLY_ACC=CAM_ASM_000338 /TAXON_ID=268821 /ORGANISM="Scrippsiella Hangoei, Strain SHTV-5" /LENGTH=424 /DNA_ID=CAMNT_0050784637 /DNA_START=61 /DNA_END=1335 /DNA_ORIENTATION=+